MVEILGVTLPVFAIIALGWLSSRWGLVEDNWIHVLNTFVYFVSLPALIIIGFWHLDFSGDTLYEFVGVHLVSMIVIALVVALILAPIRIKRSLKASIFIGGLMGNTVYMGFPIGTATFGQKFQSPVVLSATIFLLFGLVLSIIYIELLKKGHRSFATHIKDFVSNPLLVALVVGILLNVVPFTGFTAVFLDNTLSMLGATASPVALFALGVFFKDTSFRKNLKWVSLSSLIKLVVFPISIILAFIVLDGFEVNLISEDLKDIALLISAMPAAVTSFVLAERFSLDKSVAANTIVFSTLISFITISLLLLFI